MYKQRHSTSDADVQLIREFQLRQIIYNKAAPHFKNKYLTDNAWDEIAAKVGGDVHRIRDRVNQLRNRYNLEKRKVDLQKAEGFPNATSTWPLFGYLRFLDGHIRPRKSYKAMGRLKRPVGRPRRDYGYNDAGYSMHSERYANPLALQVQQQQQLQKEEAEALSDAQSHVRIKLEPSANSHYSDTNNYNSDIESEVEGNDYNTDNKSQSDGEQFINPASFLDASDDITEEPEQDDVSERHNEPISRNAAIQPPPPISRMNLSIRNINSLQREHQALTNGDATTSNRGSKPPIELDSGSEMSTPNQSRRATNSRKEPSHDKFHAFGQFMASSLIDMPEKNALELVEKFTIEIVQKLIAAKSIAADNKSCNEDN